MLRTVIDWCSRESWWTD